jgi:hypothetical protein
LFLDESFHLLFLIKLISDILSTLKGAFPIMANTWVQITNSVRSADPVTILAASYESRATSIAKLFVGLVSFAGDTAQTATDGSFNSVPTSTLKSSTAILATPSNILNVPGQTTTAGANWVSAKPLVVKVQRDPFTGEVLNYGVFNADGSVPGQPGGGYTPGQPGDPFLAANNPRYLVDRMTGQVYLNNAAGIVGVNLDANAGPEISAGAAGVGNVIGIVEFKALEGAALSTAQQQASELSNVIQSLATLIRGFKDSERNMLNTIR